MYIFSIFSTLWSYFTHYYYQLIGVAPDIEAPPTVPLVSYQRNPFPYQTKDVNISEVSELITPVVEMNTQAIYVHQGSENQEGHEIQVFIPKDGVRVNPFQVCIIVLIIYILLKWIKGVQNVSKEEEEAAINERYLEQSEDLMDSTSSHRVAQDLENTSQSANDISNFLQIETVEYFPAEKEDDNESIGSIYEEASDELESKDISVPNVLMDLDGIENRLEEVGAEAGSVSARSFTSQEFISLEESIDELETMDVPPLERSEAAKIIQSRSKQTGEGYSVSEKHGTSERLLLDKESCELIIKDIPPEGLKDINCSEQKDEGEGEDVSQNHLASQGILSDEKSCDELELGIIQLEGSKSIKVHSEQKDNLLLQKSLVSHGFLSAEEFCEQQVTNDMSIISGSEDDKDIGNLFQKKDNENGSVLEESLASHLSDQSEGFIVRKNKEQEEENGEISEGLSSDGDSREERQTMDVSPREGSEYKMQISNDLKNEPVFGDDSTSNAQGALPTDEEELQSKNKDTTNLSGCESHFERDNINHNNETAEDNTCDLESELSHNLKTPDNEIIPETINFDGTVQLVLYTPNGHPYELNCTVVPDA